MRTIAAPRKGPCGLYCPRTPSSDRLLTRGAIGIRRGLEWRCKLPEARGLVHSTLNVTLHTFDCPHLRAEALRHPQHVHLPPGPPVEHSPIAESGTLTEYLNALDVLPQRPDNRWGISPMRLSQHRCRPVLSLETRPVEIRGHQSGQKAPTALLRLNRATFHRPIATIKPEDSTSRRLASRRLHGLRCGNFDSAVLATQHLRWRPGYHSRHSKFIGGRASCAPAL